MSERMQRLAQFCVETRFEDLPPALVAQAKRHILDTFGATLAGAGSEVAKQARQVFDGEVGSTLIWGTDQRTGAAQAAMLNGVAAHALELDDTGGCDHSGAVVLPAVMAARFTQRGITGLTKLFDNVWGGFLKTLAGEAAQPDALDADLGVVWTRPLLDQALRGVPRNPFGD